MLIGLLALILTLILVVGLHELGHALAANVFGVKIQRISIGFGKPILRWQDKKDREWVWATWPLGGYVKLLNSRIDAVNPTDYPFCFDKQAAWRRVVILLAGGIANFIVALVSLTLFNMLGHQETLPIIQEVRPNSVASTAGLAINDRFLSVDNWSTESIQEVASVFIMNLGKPDVVATVTNSNNTVRQVHLNLKHNTEKNSKALLEFVGISFGKLNQTKQLIPPKPFFKAFKQAINTSFRILYFLMVTLKQLIVKAIPFSFLLGPISFISLSIASFKHGVAAFLYFIASLNLTVGLVNLFPIPSLDGGSIIFTLLEKIRGKPISIPLEILLYRLVLIAFCVFLIQLMVNDLQRYAT